MNVVHFISGKHANGLEEDAINLYKGDAGVLLQWVIDGRDVDDQVSLPAGLTAADFEPCTTNEIACVDEFQALIDEAFPDRCKDYIAADWFKSGVEDGRDEEGYDESEDEEGFEEDEDEGDTGIVCDEEEIE